LSIQGPGFEDLGVKGLSCGAPLGVCSEDARWEAWDGRGGGVRVVTRQHLPGFRV